MVTSTNKPLRCVKVKRNWNFKKINQWTSLWPCHLQAGSKAVGVQQSEGERAMGGEQRAVMMLGSQGTYVTCMWQVDWLWPGSSWWFCPRATPRGRWYPPAAPQTLARNLWLHLHTTNVPENNHNKRVRATSRRYQGVKAPCLAGSSGAVPSKQTAAELRCNKWGVGD